MKVWSSVFFSLALAATTACGDDGGGSSDSGTCEAPSKVCDGVCTSTNTDNSNCGKCGELCDPGAACVAGSCELTCGGRQIVCAGRCVDPNFDRDFCGASDDCSGDSAGTTCAPGEICDGEGSCEASCMMGMRSCDGTCIDPDTNPNYCGAGNNCSNDPGEECGDGEACVAGACVTVSGGALVNPGFENDFIGWSLTETGGSGLYFIGESGDLLNQVFFNFHDGVNVGMSCEAEFTGTDVQIAEGTKAAILDATASGVHRIWQDVSVPADATTLSFDIAYASGAAFDPDGANPQFWALNVRDPASDDILTTEFKTEDGVDPQALQTMTTRSVDLSDYAGDLVRIDFELNAQDDCFPVNLDNFRFE